MFEESELLLGDGQGSHEAAFDKYNALGTCFGAPIAAHVRVIFLEIVDVPIILISLHPLYGRVMDPCILGYIPHFASG